MAAGQNGSYRESGLEASRRIRYEDVRSRESRVRVSSRERNEINGKNYNRDQIHSKSSDREPGEVSSEEEDYKASKREEKRLKFSPIVWDRYDKKQTSTATTLRNGSNELPPPPPLPKDFVPGTSETEIFSANVKMNDEHEVEDGEAGLSRHISSSRWADNDDNDDMDEANTSITKKRKITPLADKKISPETEEVVVREESRHISSSRWADNDDNYESNASVIKKKKTTPLADKRSSPEIKEVVSREGSQGNNSKSTGSGRDDRDSDRENEVDKDGYMDIDGNDDYQSDHGSDSEDEDGKTSLVPSTPPQRSINMLQGCRSVDDFERLNKIDEGTYGVVYRAKDKKTGEVVALKKVKMEKEREGFPLTSLREINILLSFHHPSIVDVKEVVVGSSLDSIFMVMEYMEHDLKALMETMKQPFSQSEVKCLMLQLLSGVKYLHDNWVLHRDLKTSNLLLNNQGDLKICDFGLSRQYGSPLKPYTHLVVTLWYRSPELLLGAKEYSTAIDMWSLGCVMAELLAKEPLFSGKSEFDQLDKIFRTLGTPNEKIWPGFSKLPGVKVNFVKQPYNRLREKFPPTSFSGRPTLSEAGFDLLNKLLTYDPEKRITSEAALNHPWFREVPLPKSKDFMPTFPAQHAQDRRLRRIMKSPDPLEEQRRKELQLGDKLGAGGLFG